MFRIRDSRRTFRGWRQNTGKVIGLRALENSAFLEMPNSAVN